MRDHTIGDLGVARRIEVIVVQVEDGVRVCGAGSLESDGDEVLAQNLGEDGRAQGAVLVEDLVADVLNTATSQYINCPWAHRISHARERELTQALILPL